MALASLERANVAGTEHEYGNFDIVTYLCILLLLV